MKKRIFYYMAAMMLALGFTSCSKDDEVSATFKDTYTIKYSSLNASSAEMMAVQTVFNGAFGITADNPTVTIEGTDSAACQKQFTDIADKAKAQLSKMTFDGRVGIIARNSKKHIAYKDIIGSSDNSNSLLYCFDSVEDDYNWGSELFVVGYKGVEDKDYVCDHPVNNNIYLGFRGTNNYDEAISDIIVVKTSYPSLEFEYNGHIYHLAMDYDYDYDEISFANIIRNTSGEGLYLYYSKDSGLRGTIEIGSFDTVITNNLSIGGDFAPLIDAKGNKISDAANLSVIPGENLYLRCWY